MYFHTLPNLVASTKATWPGDQGNGTLRGKCVHGGAQCSRFDVEFAFPNRGTLRPEHLRPSYATTIAELRVAIRLSPSRLSFL
jgi:hypothetical protein